MYAGLPVRAQDQSKITSLRQYQGRQQISFAGPISNDSLKILKNNIEVTLEYEENPYQYPDTRPSIIAAHQLHDQLGFPEYNFRIFMRYIEWCSGTARFFMHLINVTLKEIVLIHEKDNMSIRYLNNIDQLKIDIENLNDTIKTFASFADALRRSDHIFCRM